MVQYPSIDLQGSHHVWISSLEQTSYYTIRNKHGIVQHSIVGRYALT